MHPQMIAYCFLEDVFGADAGDRAVYNGPLLPRWLAQFDVENRPAATAHAKRLEAEFGSYSWNLLGWFDSSRCYHGDLGRSSSSSSIQER